MDMAPISSPGPDRVLVGNALSRGQPVVEAMLDEGLPYPSGPEWLGREILNGRWVLAVSGTHGKTSTASMLAWILDHAGLEPGFLIGGVPSISVSLPVLDRGATLSLRQMNMTPLFSTSGRSLCTTAPTRWSSTIWNMITLIFSQPCGDRNPVSSSDPVSRATDRLSAGWRCHRSCSGTRRLDAGSICKG